MTGVGFNGLFGRDEDLSGRRFSSPGRRPGPLRKKKMIEVFHRFQATRHSQLSLGARIVLDPGNAPDEDAMGFFHTRFRTSF